VVSALLMRGVSTPGGNMRRASYTTASVYGSRSRSSWVSSLHEVQVCNEQRWRDAAGNNRSGTDTHRHGSARSACSVQKQALAGTLNLRLLTSGQPVRTRYRWRYLPAAKCIDLST